ncbi:mitochondrial substrate carrier family protein J [Acrasis kona]|uniref:Mitochondrial substrate carrier family protein J n=1 Tax=Acrasis kona TaxID=1008807 RepID=A0AAW2YL64_9EUKA
MSDTSVIDNVDVQNEGNETKKKPIYNLGIQWSELNVKKFLAVGIGVYLAESAIYYPFELVKTRMQVSKGNHSMLADTYRTARSIVATNGMRGLFHGYWTSTLGTLPCEVVYILSYNYYKETFQKFYEKQTGNKMELATFVPLAAGALADFTGQVFFVPADVVTQRLQIEKQLKKNGYEMMREILKESGVRGLYKGFWASVCTNGPQSSIWWTSYELYKRQLSDHDPRELFGYVPKVKEGEVTQNYFAQISAGVLAALTTCTAINPLDVSKTRLQTQTAQNTKPEDMLKNVFSGVKQIAKKEGYKALYKGLVPKMMVYAPFMGCSSLIYEWVLKVCRKKELD